MRITENEQGYSPRERQMLIYRYLLENSNKNFVVSTKRLLDYLDTFDIKTHINTLYNDLAEISTTFICAELPRGANASESPPEHQNP